MLLGFKKSFPDGQPTHFKEKILAGLYPSGVYAESGFVPKIHTIRNDPHDRWKPGMSIQFAHGVRTPNLEIWYDSRGEERGHVVSTQRILILPIGLVQVEVEGAGGKPKTLNEAETEEMARNDGFDSVEDLIDWFYGEKGRRRIFIGKLIHWTDKRY